MTLSKPPMGWSSWNCFATSISDEIIRTQARAIKESRLDHHGFNYINIDDGWQGERAGKHNSLQGNSKFPDMNDLVSYIHSLGLKIGIYSTPWEKSYGGYPGSKGYETNDVEQFCKWGFDFLKYDWDMSDPSTPHEIYLTTIRKAIDKSGHDMILSLSNSAPMEKASVWAQNANMWRTTGDIVDTWESVYGIGLYQLEWQNFKSPGHWCDPDMLVIGKLGWGGEIRPTQLTPTEQRTHITLWSILGAPLILGCDLTKLDELTYTLLTNREVIRINQDCKCSPCRKIMQKNEIDILTRSLGNNSLAMAFINSRNDAQNLEITLDELGINTTVKMKDLWAENDTTIDNKKIKIALEPHESKFYKLS
ncbi:MAG: glycoside hydrolase family 27 protein [Bacteriovoracaceae bacterium]|nr:glycoside hydrolase family 27 protein [Bacteriovoracaceae bacterium]